MLCEGIQWVLTVKEQQTTSTANDMRTQNVKLKTSSQVGTDEVWVTLTSLKLALYLFIEQGKLL